MPHLSARLKKKQSQEGAIGVRFVGLFIWTPPPTPPPKNTCMHTNTEQQEAIARENRRLLGQMLTTMERDPRGQEAISGKERRKGFGCMYVYLYICICMPLLPGA